MTTVKNGKSRFNTNHSAVRGPRECLILSLLLKHRDAAKNGAHVTMTAVEVGTAFGFAKPTSANATLKRLVRKGEVICYSAKGKVCVDGYINGARYGLSPNGMKLARRIEEVSGLGRTLAIVSGYRIETPISE